MPPTSNHAFKRCRGFRDYPSKKMLDFQHNFDLWALKNEFQLGVTRNFIAHEFMKFNNSEVLSLGLKVTFKRIFYFAKSEVFYKNNNRKKVDLTNRIKYLDDYLCKKLTLDDMYVMSGSEEMELSDDASYVDVYVDVLR